MPLRLRFTRRPLPAKDAAAYLARAIAAAPYRYLARVTVRAPAEAVRACTYASLPGEIEPVDDHTCVVRLRTDSVDLITQHLAAWGADFILEGPQEVLDHLHAVGRRLIEVGGAPRGLA